MQRHYYLIKVQYLGYRFHGWAKQPNLKTVHFMIDRTIAYVLQHKNFKTVGSSRTDAMVSASESAFELFVEKPIDESWFLNEVNKNLPSDIKLLSIETVDESFNIINSPKSKEYHYFFSFGEKVHPFCAHMIASFNDEFNIELMKQGAKLFEGIHNFKNYVLKPSENIDFNRTIDSSEIVKNDIYKANFFPKKTYIYKVKSKGFMRNQIRMMMGQLILLGKGDIDLKTIKTSLNKPDDEHLKYIAPANGLVLNRVEFK